MRDINGRRHRETRSLLRVVGPAILGVGALFTVVGIGSFFASFGTFGPPRYFWCAFVGIPLIGVGSMISKFAYMGAVTRYMANEVAPVGKDVVNYMADGTKDAVRDLASAVGEGIAAGTGGQPAAAVRCHKCNHDNDPSAKFCQNCGVPLSKSKTCGACGELNDPDARFCDNCGQAFAV